MSFCGVEEQWQVLVLVDPRRWYEYWYMDMDRVPLAVEADQARQHLP